MVLETPPDWLFESRHFDLYRGDFVVLSLECLVHATQLVHVQRLDCQNLDRVFALPEVAVFIEKFENTDTTCYRGAFFGVDLQLEDNIGLQHDF